jgi:small subunit ribosomal protein S17
MADEEKNEIEEPTEAAEPEAEAEAPAAAEEAPAEEPVAEAEAEAEPEAAADEAAEPVAEEPVAEEPEEAAPAKPSRSRRHVPRTERRQRPKRVRGGATTRKAIVRLPKPDHERGRNRERRGVVVSDKGDKTIVVKVDVIKSHPKYKKVVRSTVKFHAHDEQNEAGLGDTVRIVETRPLSKTKRWRLAEIVEKAR